MTSFDLVEPRSIEEAFAQLDSDDPAVRPIGGGTALMLMMKAQMFKPVRLVSLRHLGPEFFGITFAPDKSSVKVGAMTRFAELEHSPGIRKHLPVIPQTMLTLANVRVRNVASVGGNLAHGDPHLDLPPVWTALDARIHIRSRDGARSIPILELFNGYYETTLAQGEVIESVEVPLKPDWCSHYVKVTTRAAHDWPALGIAISARPDGDRIGDLRLVLSAAVDRPTRLVAAEKILRGAAITDAVLDEAGEAAVAEVDIESDLRGTAEYKKHLLRVHIG
ncbi:MAG: xanthine dehydrogenase family protein subunit M, partial [Hyphomicrobiaceae bacterium]